MSEGQRGSDYHHEEQGSLAEHHPGGGVHPHGSVDCSGNYELHETGQLTVDQPTRWAKVERSPQLNKKGKVALDCSLPFLKITKENFVV
jgi:hypothetical protein